MADEGRSVRIFGDEVAGTAPSSTAGTARRDAGALATEEVDHDMADDDIEILDDDWDDDPVPGTPPAVTGSGDQPLVVATSEVELPHWSEPATGQVPAIFGEGEGSAEPAPDPRFRADSGDWTEDDFAQLSLEEDEREGALAADVDDDAAFDAAVLARRSGARTVVSTTPGVPRRAPRAEGTDESGGAPEDVFDEEFGDGPSSGRNLPTAVITGVSIAVLGLVCLYIGSAATTALAAVIAGVCAYEFVQGLRTKPAFKPAGPLVVAGSALMPVATYNYGTGAFAVVGAVMTMATVLWYLMRVGPGRPVAGVASSLLVFGYVGGFVGFAGLMLAAPNDTGTTIVLGAVICAVGYDVFGYFAGSRYGRDHIAPTISPNKTFQGTAAGVLAAFLLGVFVVGGLLGDPWNAKHGVFLGLLVAASAFVGDLVESMFKRDLDLKDFGTLLPGHGGFFDRFDGLLFSLPVVFFLATQLDFFVPVR